MIVCGHGDVIDYCGEHNMVIVDWYVGDLKEYNGVCPILVTDSEISENEYYYLKGFLLSRGYELISILHSDTECMSEQMIYTAQREKENRKKFGGRCKFGFRRVNGKEVPFEEQMKVVRRIIELRDMGYTYAAIREDSGVRGVSGDKMCISTINLIIKNRKDYGL